MTSPTLTDTESRCAYVTCTFVWSSLSYSIVTLFPASVCPLWLTLTTLPFDSVAKRISLSHLMSIPECICFFDGSSGSSRTPKGEVTNRKSSRLRGKEYSVARILSSATIGWVSFLSTLTSPIVFPSDCNCAITSLSYLSSPLRSIIC